MNRCITIAKRVGQVVKCAVWLLSGNKEDIKKCLLFAQKEGYTVFVFPGDHIGDPIEESKRAFAGMEKNQPIVYIS